MKEKSPLQDPSKRKSGAMFKLPNCSTYTYVLEGSCLCSFPVLSQFLIHISFISIFHFFHFIFENNHINKKAWAQTNQILYQHYASKLQKFSHCKFKHEKPDLIKEHNKAREIHNDTYPRPFISSSADPCFLVRPVNAKAFSAE